MTSSTSDREAFDKYYQQEKLYALEGVGSVYFAHCWYAAIAHAKSEIKLPSDLEIKEESSGWVYVAPSEIKTISLKTANLLTRTAFRAGCDWCRNKTKKLNKLGESK